MSSIGWDELEASSAGPVLVGPFKARPPRQRTCLSGKLVYGDGGYANVFTLDCRIHDISEGGAKVTLAQHRPLPSSLYLIIIKFCVAHRADLAWMKYPSRGLRFCETYPMEGPLPEEAKFLRKLWGDLYVRDGGIQQ